MGWQAWLTLAVVMAMFIERVRSLAHPAMAILSAVIGLPMALVGIVLVVIAVSFGLGWRFVLLGIVAATVVLTEFISNNAAAALMFPIVMATASQVGADPRAFAISPSNSFLTPNGYQTNTMAFGPGGYRCSDYLRLGAPLAIASVLTVVFTACGVGAETALRRCLRINIRLRT